MNININKNIPMYQDERLYSGTFFPNPFRRWLTYYSFQTLFYLFYGLERLKELVNPPNNSPTSSSYEMRALRKLLSITKHWTTNTLEYIRQPFLSIVTRSFRPDQLLENYSSNSCRVYGVWTGTIFDSLPSRVIVYIHGGGYVSGDIAGFLSVADKIATILKCPVFLPEYSLVPEHTVQDAVQDLVCALQRVTEKYPTTQIGLCGDSAGGGLMFRLLDEWIKQKGTCDPIDKCVAWSPMIDLKTKGQSMWLNRDLDPCLSASVVKYCARMASQTCTDCAWNLRWELFPETRIVVCTDEILFDDSYKAYKMLKNVTLEKVSNSFHGFANFWEYIPEGVEELYKLDYFYSQKSQAIIGAEIAE